jgi:hypothetical protein
MTARLCRSAIPNAKRAGNVSFFLQLAANVLTGDFDRSAVLAVALLDYRASDKQLNTWQTEMDGSDRAKFLNNLNLFRYTASTGVVRNRARTARP